MRHLPMLAAALMASLAHGEPEAEEARPVSAILDDSGIAGGVIVHLGCGNGERTPSLLINKRFIVRGLDVDAEAIADARAHVDKLGLADRISFETWSGDRLPFPDNFVNALAVETSGTAGEEELLRAVAPGGVLLSRRGGRWGGRRKSWPASLDEWTHSRHGADGNAVADDSVVGPPARLQWIAEPMWLKHHNTTISFSAMVSAKGRVFYILDESMPGVFGVPERWRLVARDAFNGAVLWKRDIARWGWGAWGDAKPARSRFDQPVELHRRLVATGDHVYAPLGADAPVSRLNAATGKTTHTYAGSEGVSELYLHEGKLVVSVHRPPKEAGGRKPMALLVYDAVSGKRLVEKTGLIGTVTKSNVLSRYPNLLMAIRGDAAFAVDGNDVVCLALEDGSERWRRPRPPRQAKPENYSKSYLINQCVLVAHEDVLLLNQLRYSNHTAWDRATPSTLVAFAAGDGKKLWEYEGGSWDYDAPGSFFVIDGLAWTYTKDGFAIVGLDPKTGKERKRYSTEKAMTTGHHHRCHSNKAAGKYILSGRRGVEFIDIRTGENRLHNWVRGACRFGVMPCNGLLYVPPDPCMCYATAKVNGLVALAGEGETCRVSRAEGRLEKGPAYGQHATANAKDAVRKVVAWPTYRHDAERSGSTPGVVAAKLEEAWRAEIGGWLSGVTCAGGTLFVSAVDAHTVHALDAGTGKERWRFAAASRVNTPPTLHDGLALFGSADGNVYALCAADGALCWRFRAAPGARQLMALGQLESAWPVHGSVLVREGVAYVTAGRSSFLDGGIVLYALDPATGGVLRQYTIYTPDPQTGEVDYGTKLRYDMPIDKPGALSDVLVSSGESIYLRHLRFDPGDFSRDFAVDVTDEQRRHFLQTKVQCGKVYRPGPHLATSATLLDESWFNQTFWTYDSRFHCRMLVFDDTRVFGLRAYGGNSSRHARAKFTVGRSSCTLFAGERASGKEERVWSSKIPIRVLAMVGTRDTLFAAGPVVGSQSSPADWGGRKSGVLRAVAKKDGAGLGEYPLTASPVWDGMAAANGRLYAALRDGAVVCFEAAP